jgi:1-acyl-sn-glycerol-3-phosphate acyltransferase
VLFTIPELLLRFAFLRLHRGKLTPGDRAVWMHQSCALMLRRMGIAVASEGPRPHAGLIISNHLSYLDILVHAAIGPRIFVSKSEVRSWPAIGLLAHLGGTIFIQRDRRAHAMEAAFEIEAFLSAGIPVVLFPEGTSTDGATLLPFYSFLFEPAVEAASPVTAAALSYQAEDAEERDLCYYGDIHFAPHFIETLGHRDVRGKIRFDGQARIYKNRKQAANDAWERVARLRLRAQTTEHADVAGWR